MAVVSYSVLLENARREGYAVGCFDAVDHLSAQTCIDTAVRLRSPIMLALSQVHLKYLDPCRLTKEMLRMAEEASVPVCLQFDHATDESLIRQAIDWGMNAVLYDLSALPLDEHIEKMKPVTAYCHERGVCIEGELGRHGSRWSAEEGSSYGAHKKTDPAAVARYVEETGVDGLAVYVGNSHSRLDEEAHLDVGLLDAIAEASPVPLVLHGSSGLDKKDVSVLISRGVLKVNNYTELSRAAVSALRSALSIPTWSDYHPLPGIAASAMEKVIEEKLRTFGSVGKA